MPRTPIVGCLCLLALAALPARAQEPAPRPAADTLARLDLPREVAQGLIDFFNHPGTLHFSGATRVPAERTITGDVAVLGGPLTLAGRIEGRLVVINGGLHLLPGATITGGVTVVGGELRGADSAVVGGEVLVYAERLRYQRRGDRLVHRAGWDGWRRVRQPRRPDGGRSDFLIATGRSYNRVEGLPITFGPVIETSGNNPLRLRALGIYRTENGATLDDLGYFLRAEQFLFGRRALRLGATLHSVVDPIEGWQLSDLENGLATFVLHQDYRDHYQREGGSAFVRYQPRGRALSLGAETRWERHRSLPAGDPWALFGSREWRLQPLVAEGRLTSLALEAAIDTRNDPDDPSTGWLVRSELESGLDVDLARPAAGFTTAPADEPVLVTLPPKRYGHFNTLALDVRRYNRVGPDSRLNLRLLAASSLAREGLPPQRQHALGGEGSLPGYSLFSRDCGARAEPPVRRLRAAAPGELLPGTAYFPRYGCDGFALIQAEYRGDLALRFDWGGDPWGEDDDDDTALGDGWMDVWSAAPDWIVFFDAGRAWAFEPRRTEKLVLDLGVGLVLDRVGLYVAVPLRGQGGANLFVRLGPRF